MASYIIDSFTYNGEKIGGTSGSTHDTEVLEHYRMRTTQDDAELVFRFAVRVTPSNNATTDFNALNAACQAIEAVLRQRYARLEIDWGTGPNPVEVFDPNVSAATFPSSGFDQEPSLEKIPNWPHTGLSRGYEFRVRLAQSPNYTDAYGVAAGRRQVDVTIHFDLDQRLTAVVTGEWTQVGGNPGKLGRNQFLAQVDAYAAYRLSLLANAGPVGGFVAVAGNAVTGSGTSFTKLLVGTVVWFGSQPGTAFTITAVNSDTSITLSGSPTASAQTSMVVGQWALARRDESDPNSLSTLRFSREYQQHVFGRRASTVEVFFGEQRLRRITVRGSYLRTISGSGTYGNQFGTAAGSLANFADATNGGRAYAETATTGQLATLTAAQGGALAPNYYELLTEPFVTTNEQDDRTEYTLVYRELNQKQSNAATILKDPNITGDSMQFAAVFSEVQDSTSAPLAAAIPGPGGSQVAPSGSSNPVAMRNSIFSSSGQIPATIEKATGSPSSVSGASVDVQKPIDLVVSYDAFLVKGIANPVGYYVAQIEPLLISLFSSLFGFTGVEFVNRSPRFDPTSNRVGADLRLRAYSGNVVLFVFTLGRFNDTGVRLDPAFTGTPHEYLVQQALPKSTMARKVEAVYRNAPGAGAFSLDPFISPQALQGWVKVSDSQPATVTKTLGIPGLGVAQTVLTYATLEENFVWVARNVGQGGGGTPTGGGGSQVTTGIPMTVSPPPVAPRVATGSG